MTERLPPHVIRDLGAKLSADIHDATNRTVLLADAPLDQYTIGRYGLMYLIGAVCGMASRAAGISPDEAESIDSLDLAITMLVEMKKTRLASEAR